MFNLFKRKPADEYYVFHTDDYEVFIVAALAGKLEPYEYQVVYAIAIAFMNEHVTYSTADVSLMHSVMSAIQNNRNAEYYRNIVATRDDWVINEA